jgi:dethiobiotin synthetase
VDGRGEDDEALLAAAGGWQPTADRCQLKFARPLAPGVAAELEGVAVDLSVVVGQVQRLRAAAELVLVEGAGGWCVPIGGHQYTAELARLVSTEVLIVGRAGLGTINHSVLTVRAVSADGFAIRAVVLSRRPEDDLEAARRNVIEIRKATGARVLLSDDLASAL